MKRIIAWGLWVHHAVVITRTHADAGYPYSVVPFSSQAALAGKILRHVDPLDDCHTLRCPNDPHNPSSQLSSCCAYKTNALFPYKPSRGVGKGAVSARGVGTARAQRVRQVDRLRVRNADSSTTAGAGRQHHVLFYTCRNSVTD